MDSGNLNIVQKVGHAGGGMVGSVVGGVYKFCVSEYRVRVKKEAPAQVEREAEATAKVIRESIEDFGAEAAPVLLVAAIEGLVGRAMSGSSKSSTGCGDHCGKNVS